MNKIIVHGGDIPKDTYFIENDKINGLNLKNMLIELDILDSINMSERTYSGTFASGLVGYALLGPLGGIGGMLVGGSKKKTNNIVFACGLTNGITFIAESDHETFSYLKSIFSKNSQDKQLESERQKLLNEISDEKECPQCAETIKLKAKVCRFCGYEFSSEELEDSLEKANKKIRELESKINSEAEKNDSYRIELTCRGRNTEEEIIQVLVNAGYSADKLKKFANKAVENPPAVFVSNIDEKLKNQWEAYFEMNGIELVRSKVVKTNERIKTISDYPAKTAEALSRAQYQANKKKLLNRI